jgi:hypothetical protein
MASGSALPGLRHVPRRPTYTLSNSVGSCSGSELGFRFLSEADLPRDTRMAVFCCERNTAMSIGIVKRFNVTKGYGFTRPGGGSKDVFLCFSEVQRAGLQDPGEVA